MIKQFSQFVSGLKDLEPLRAMMSFQPKALPENCGYCGAPKRAEGCLDGAVCVGDDRWAQCQFLAAKHTNERLKSVGKALGMDETRFMRSWSELELEQPGWRQVRALGERIAEVRTEGVVVIAFGSLATGKTHAMCLVLRDAAARGYSVLKTQWSTFYLQYTDAQRRSSDLEENELSAEGLRRALVEPDFVLLDDIFEDTSDASKRLLREVFYARYNAKKPTFLTTNLGSGELFETVIDERSVSRVNEALLKIKFNGKQFRFPSATAKKLIAEIQGVA